MVVDAGSVEPDAGTQPDAGAPFDAGLTYVETVHPLFERAGCAAWGCHGGVLAGAGVLVYLPDARTGWLDMVNRPSARDAGVIVIPGDVEHSVLALHGRDSLVPFNVLTVAQEQVVEQWIAEGARYSVAEATAMAGGLFTTSDGAPLTCTLENGRGAPSLPPACMPRCTADTWSKVVACRSDANPTACQDAVIDADPTAAATLAGGTDVVSVDCGTCLNLQTRSCIDEHCRLELLTWDRCRVFTTGTCATEQTAVARCAGTTAFTTCQRARDALCVAP